MAFETTEAAIAALQDQEFVSAAQLPAEACQTGPLLDAALLDAAMLAGAGPGAAAEAEAAAIMAELGDMLGAPVLQPGGGDSLLALVADAPGAGEAYLPTPSEFAGPVSEALVLDGTETSPPALDYDLVLAESDPAPQEDVFPGESLGDPVVSNAGDGTIVVTGTRVRHYFMPSEPPPEPRLPGDTAVLEPEIPPGFGDPDAGYHVYELTQLGLKLRMPIAEWEALTTAQKNALFHLLENHSQSATFTAALQHLKNEGIDSVVIRWGTQGWNYDGSRYDFAPETLARVSSDRRNLEGTDLAPGSLVVITFNSAHWAAAETGWFARTMIHELFHPFVADMPQANGEPSDHDRVVPMTDEALRMIFPTGGVGWSG